MHPSVGGVPAEMNWRAFAEPIQASIKISVLAGILVFLLAVAVAWLMAKHTFRGKLIVETIMLLPLVLPPTVVGFLLLVVFGRNSWIGRGVERLTGHSLVFTWWAAVVAAIVVAFPLVYQTMKAGFQSMDDSLEEAGRSMGASEWQVFWWITLPMSQRFLLTGFALGFARGLGEFGATLMFAGNIPGKTQTIPTAIYLAVDAGNMPLAWMWCMSIVLISFVLLYSVSRLGGK